MALHERPDVAPVGEAGQLGLVGGGAIGQTRRTRHGQQGPEGQGPEDAVPVLHDSGACFGSPRIPSAKISYASPTRTRSPWSP